MTLSLSQISKEIEDVERQLGRHRYQAVGYSDEYQKRLADAENRLTEARTLLEPPEIECPRCNGKGMIRGA